MLTTALEAGILFRQGPAKSYPMLWETRPHTDLEVMGARLVLGEARFLKCPF